jgi:hypothetical protein
MQVTEVSIKPTQTLHVIIKRCLMLTLLNPPHHSLLPGATGLLSQLMHSP